MEATINILKTQHPDFTHSLYDISDCRNFLQEHFESDVLVTYDTLLPYAYKADLWRLCILYIYGGIYLDVKFLCIGDFRLTELLDSEYYAKDPVGEDISNGIMVCMPKNAYLMEAIRQIVKNVSERYYGENPLDITGPRLLYKILKVTCTLQWNGATSSYFYKNTRILQAYSQYNIDCLNSEHYTMLWKERTVYKEKVLMLVAHPDDETLFGYHDLSGATVVCFTNASNPIRSAEFYAVMSAVGATGIMFDYNDYIDDDWCYIYDSEFFERIPFYGDCIVSHDEFGEYGHVQHIRVHNIAMALAEKRCVAYRNFQEIRGDAFRDSLLDIYLSQKDNVNKYRSWGPLIKIHTKSIKIDSGKSI